jgi:outer membrane receptor protein involved in Fe transport
VKYNATVGYNVSDDIILSFTVNNLLNEDPPEDSAWTAYPYYNVFNYNGYGRSFLVEVNWQFGATQ